MTIDEIERRLRLPAPDEPAVLPALLLPVRVGTAPLPDRSIELRLGRRRRSVSLVLLGTVLLLVAALAGALLVGVLRLEQIRNVVPVPGLYAGRGMTLDYPNEWTRFTAHDPFGSSPAAVALIVGNRDVEGCEAGSEAVARHTLPPQPTPAEDGVTYMDSQSGAISAQDDRIYACLIEQPLEPGEIRLVVSRDVPQAIETGPVGDFRGRWLETNPGPGAEVLVSAETGFTETIGQMPARSVVRDGSVVPGAERLRTWFVAIPDSSDSLLWIQAVMRGPDLAALEAELDGIVQSLSFDPLPEPLDEAKRDPALAMAIDAIDRSMREHPGRRLLACMPRTPGSVTTTIDEGPRGRLARPLEVTCTTSVKEHDLRVWAATMEIGWPATADHDAGRWARQILFDADGTVQRESDIAPGTGEPMAFPGDSSDPGADVIPTFVAGDLVRSVGLGASTAFHDVPTDRLPSEPHLYLDPGALAVIISGPEVYDARDFYQADSGFEIGWVSAEAPGGVVLVPAEVTCPTRIDATELAYLSSFERHRCVSGEVVLEPVQAAGLEVEDGWDAAETHPDWLAGQPRWALHGERSVIGFDRGLPVFLAPGLQSLPTDGWLRVTGHFEDPASATCTVTYPEGWNPAAGSPEVEERRCFERFVVTSAIAVEAP